MSMTKGERSELMSLIRKREKVMKSAACERAAKMLAEFEAQSARIYNFNDDEVWRRATVEAEAAVAQAQKLIASRCAELGIPEEFAPSIRFAWYGRGENAVRDRQEELRRAAKAKIAAIEQEAMAKIEKMSLEAQTDLLATGLESDAAKLFLGSMATVESLMPSINAIEIKDQVEERLSKREASRLRYDA